VTTTTPTIWGSLSTQEGSQRFTCHPQVYPRMEWTILPLLRKHSPDGSTRARQRTSDYSSLLIYRPRKDERL